MVMATAVDVASIDDLPASDLQDILGQIYGKAKYAADAAGSAEYKADQAQAKADTLEGSIGWATGAVGAIDYHVRVMAGMIGYNGYPASL